MEKDFRSKASRKLSFRAVTKARKVPCHRRLSTLYPLEPTQSCKSKGQRRRSVVFPCRCFCLLSRFTLKDEATLWPAERGRCRPTCAVRAPPICPLLSPVDFSSSAFCSHATKDSLSFLNLCVLPFNSSTPSGQTYLLQGKTLWFFASRIIDILGD